MENAIDLLITGRRIALEKFPELPPEAPSFPAAEAIIHRIPAAKLPRQVPPGQPSAGEVGNRLEEQTVTQFRRTASLFDGREPRFKLSSGSVGDEQAYGHRHSPPCIDHAGNVNRRRQFVNKT